MTSPEGEDEDGYVLIAAIWLLVLAGSIAALLMLQSLTATRQARAEGDILRARLALDAAVETIIADRIMNGGRSIWSRTAVDGTIQIENMAIRARATSEAQRVDLMRADPRLVDTTLRTAGLGANQRQRVIARIALQAGNAQALSFAMISNVLKAGEPVDVGTGPCLLDLFTPFPSGRTTQGDEAMADTIALDEPLRPGLIQRLELQAPSGVSLTVLVRVIGQRGQAVSVLEWLPYRLCVE
jgi:hypothetical protein